jgi:hypothetical protein
VTFSPGESFVYFRDRDPGGRTQRRALRVVFFNVPKSTLRTNNRLNAVLGPLLGGPDRADSLYRGSKRGRRVCVFITAVPNTKLCAWGEEDSGGHVL